jgi:hypothetical protein
LHVAGIFGSWCCRHRKSLGERRQIGPGHTVERRNTMGLRCNVYLRRYGRRNDLDKQSKQILLQHRDYSRLA